MDKRTIHRVATRLRKTLEALPDGAEFRIRNLAEMAYAQEPYDTDSDIFNVLGFDNFHDRHKLISEFSQMLHREDYFIDNSKFAYMYVGFDPLVMVRKFDSIIKESPSWPVIGFDETNVRINGEIIAKKDSSSCDYIRKYLIDIPANSSMDFDFEPGQAIFLWPVDGEISLRCKYYECSIINDSPSRVRKFIVSRVIKRGDNFSHAYKRKYRYSDSLLVTNAGESTAQFYLAIRKP